LRLRAMKGESSYGNAPLEAHGSTGGAFRDWDDLPTPHGTPTSFAIAEYPPDPIGAPYSHSVEVLDSLLPSLFSISNLCWSMTRSITEYYSLRFREIWLCVDLLTTLALFELHLLLEGGTKGIKWVAFRDYLF